MGIGLLMAIFVMLAEVLIFVPSIARFREDYLLTRLERAQIASLVRLKLLEQPSQAMDLDQVKYRCNVGQALVKALAAGAELDLSKFLYDEEQV